MVSETGLAQVFSGLVRHHIAHAGGELPPPQPGITWVWARNGVFKRGCNAHLDILIPVGRAPAVPGLAPLLPHVRWGDWPGRLPGQLLAPLLHHARRACSPDRIARPIEQQYFLVWRDGDVRLVAPPGQDAGPGHVRYRMPRGVVLADIHSHHGMAAYFSGTDDYDDVGLSVSAVVGRIFGDRPQIVVRLNVFGHRYQVPAALVFDRLAPCWQEGTRDAQLRD